MIYTVEFCGQQDCRFDLSDMGERGYVVDQGIQIFQTRRFDETDQILGSDR